MKRGDLYTAFVPDLIAERRRAGRACAVYNEKATTEGTTRREQVKMLSVCAPFRFPMSHQGRTDGSASRMIPSLPELPPQKDDAEEDEGQFSDFPWVEPPFRCDYGSNVSYVLFPLPQKSKRPSRRAELTFSAFSPASSLAFGPFPPSTLLSIGTGTLINFGFIAIDTCAITIGSRVLFGPNVQLYAQSPSLAPPSAPTLLHPRRPT